MLISPEVARWRSSSILPSSSAIGFSKSRKVGMPPSPHFRPKAVSTSYHGCRTGGERKLPGANNRARDRSHDVPGGVLGRFHLFGLSDQHFGLADRGDIDQPAVERNRSLALALGLFHRFEDALGLGDFGLARTEDLVCECDLAGVDRPFAFASEHGGPIRLRLVSVRVGEIAKGSID